MSLKMSGRHHDIWRRILFALHLILPWESFGPVRKMLTLVLHQPLSQASGRYTLYPSF